ncbi:hypothetical protein CLAIMM_02456 [Cladophialophora immunda]|nr:hypothetical protein CLAIMM_02456 [Cladophialophora immunda]
MRFEARADFPAFNSSPLATPPPVLRTEQSEPVRNQPQSSRIKGITQGQEDRGYALCQLKISENAQIIFRAHGQNTAQSAQYPEIRVIVARGRLLDREDFDKFTRDSLCSHPVVEQSEKRGFNTPECTEPHTLDTDIGQLSK